MSIVVSHHLRYRSWYHPSGVWYRSVVACLLTYVRVNPPLSLGKSRSPAYEDSPRQGTAGSQGGKRSIRPA